MRSATTDAKNVANERYALQIECRVRARVRVRVRVSFASERYALQIQSH